MPIVDNEVVSDFNFEITPVTCHIGQYVLETLDKNFETFGDADWMTDTSAKKTLKFSDLRDVMNKFGSALWKKGFRPGGSVLLMAANYIELALALFGTWRVGGNIACLTLNLLPHDIRTRMNDTKPMFVVTDELRVDRVLEAIKGLDYVPEVIVIGENDKCTSFNAFVDDDGKGCPDEVKVDLDAMAWLMYSSGTTGVPKGIVHTHRTISLILQHAMRKPMPNYKVLFMNLMINSGGTGTLLMSTLSHSHCITLSNFSDENLLEAASEVKPNVMSAFPSQIVWICRHPNLEKYDLSSISVITTGGSTMNPIYERQIFDRLPNLRLIDMTYGLSETSFIAKNSLRFSEFPKSKEEALERHVVGSSGLLCSNCRLKIISEETGDKLGPGEIGEICVKAPYLMREYLNNPKGTADMMKDGWCHTGDKGYYDSNGNIFVVGRYKELIKYRMAHVLPTNIEKYLLTHPAVEDAGVVGLPHEVDGEKPLAFVVIRPNHQVTDEELIAFIDERVPDEERLRGGIRYIDNIPRNDLGKIVRGKLVALL